VRPRAVEEGQRLGEGGPRLAAVADHHVVAELDAVLLGDGAGLEDLVHGDLLVDGVENLLRAGLDAEAQALASGETHLVEELFAEDVDARIAAPQEA